MRDIVASFCAQEGSRNRLSGTRKSHKLIFFYWELDFVLYGQGKAGFFQIAAMLIKQNKQLCPNQNSGKNAHIKEELGPESYIMFKQSLGDS